jgi:hypothetical protein
MERDVDRFLDDDQEAQGDRALEQEVGLEEAGLGRPPLGEPAQMLRHDGELARRRSASSWASGGATSGRIRLGAGG